MVIAIWGLTILMMVPVGGSPLGAYPILKAQHCIKQLVRHLHPQKKLKQRAKQAVPARKGRV